MQIKRISVGILQTNCYLLISNKEIGIVDPGAEIQRIIREIEELGGEPKYIINTHYHLDHTGGVKELQKKTKAKILIHKEEKDFIDFEPDQFLKEGDKIKIGDSVLNVIHTPGHTKGSICLLGEGFILTGDTLFKEGCGRTDLKGGSEKDLLASLERLRSILKPGMVVYPGHGECFRIK